MYFKEIPLSTHVILFVIADKTAINRYLQSQEFVVTTLLEGFLRLKQMTIISWQIKFIDVLVSLICVFLYIT